MCCDKEVNLERKGIPFAFWSAFVLMFRHRPRRPLSPPHPPTNLPFVFPLSLQNTTTKQTRKSTLTQRIESLVIRTHPIKQKTLHVPHVRSSASKNQHLDSVFRANQEIVCASLIAPPFFYACKSHENRVKTYEACNETWNTNNFFLFAFAISTVHFQSKKKKNTKTKNDRLILFPCRYFHWNLPAKASHLCNVVDFTSLLL